MVCSVRYLEFELHLRAEGDEGPKLVLDLKMWVEIQRYKNLVHLHRCEKLTKQKMRVIVVTFLSHQDGSGSSALPVHVADDLASCPLT